jgi:hypothetical protein
MKYKLTAYFENEGKEVVFFTITTKCESVIVKTMLGRENLRFTLEEIEWNLSLLKTVAFKINGKDKRKLMNLDWSK